MCYNIDVEIYCGCFMFKPILATYIMFVFNSVIICGREPIYEDSKLPKDLHNYEKIEGKSVIRSEVPILPNLPKYKKTCVTSSNRKCDVSKGDLNVRIDSAMSSNRKCDVSRNLLNVRAIDSQQSTFGGKSRFYKPYDSTGVSGIKPLARKKVRYQIGNTIKLNVTSFETSSYEVEISAKEARKLFGQ